MSDEIFIKRAVVGRVIGTKGANIQAVERGTKTTITTVKTEAPKQAVIVSGRRKTNIEAAIKAIKNLAETGCCEFTKVHLWCAFLHIQINNEE